MWFARAILQLKKCVLPYEGGLAAVGEGAVTLSDCRVSLLSCLRCEVLVDFPCDLFLSLRFLKFLLRSNGLGLYVPSELNLGLLTVNRAPLMNSFCHVELFVCCAISFTPIAVLRS